MCLQRLLILVLKLLPTLHRVATLQRSEETQDPLLGPLWSTSSLQTAFLNCYDHGDLRLDYSRHIVTLSPVQYKLYRSMRHEKCRLQLTMVLKFSQR